jgi:hypothetical protein
MTKERPLQRVEQWRTPSQSFNRRDLVSLGLRG